MSGKLDSGSNLPHNEAYEHASPLMSDFVEQQYLPFIQKSKRSWKVDRGNLNCHILPYLGSYQLAEINADVLNKWINTLQLSGLAYNSCRRQLFVAKRILNCAVKWGILKSNVEFKNASLPYEQNRSRRPVLLEASEIRRLLDILAKRENIPSANAIRLLILTGATRSEILDARWDGVDFSSGMLVTRQSFTGGKRYIPLNNEALKLIRRLPRKEGCPWLFYTSRGTRLKYITRYWYAIRDEFGHHDLHLNDLRHCFANFLFELGASGRDVLAIMGHYRSGAIQLVREKNRGKREHEMA